MYYVISELLKFKKLKLKLFCYLFLLIFLKLKAYGNIDKIDSNGNYIAFPGITVLSHINRDELNIWKQLYNNLNKSKIIKEYYSLLPVESYHLTLINLYTKAYTSKNNEDHWRNFIIKKNKMFISLKNYLEENTFLPSIQTMNIVLPKMSNNTIAIEVPLTQEQKEKINKISNHFNLSKKVPKPFHITLAYSYKLIPSKIYLEIQSEFNKIVTENLLQYNMPLNFEEPKIYYFHDMTLFKKWNQNIKEIK